MTFKIGTTRNPSRAAAVPARVLLALGAGLALLACGGGETDASGAPVAQAPPEIMPGSNASVSTVDTTPPTTGGAPASGGPVQPEEEVLVEDDTSGEPKGGFLPSERVDLLFVIDNSTSMADKQAIFKAAIPDLIDQMVNPPCRITETGAFKPYDPVDGCGGDAARLFNPVDDIHIAMISSSLGPQGTEGVEIPFGCTDVIEENDRAWLLGRVRPTLSEESYQGWGFLNWDAKQKAAPPGDSDLATLIAKFEHQVDTIGEGGCGYEAPLEAAYRFLSEPDPYESLQRVPCDGQTTDELLCAEPVGVDMDLLAQRAQFLRPDSVVVVMYLTDENDCSVRANGQGFLAMSNTRLGGATNECAANPNDPCCFPCSAVIPDSCNTDPATNGCGDNETDQVEARTLRCFDQERRYGVSFLRSTKVYIGGFTNAFVADRDGNAQPNALFTEDRGRDKIFVVGIIGVPWQDTSDPEKETANNFDLIESTEVDWARLLPTGGQFPTDPFNIEAMGMRDGTHPVTGETLGGPGTWNSINGHDRPLFTDDGAVDDLQYSCIFQLPEPRDCEGQDPENCDCAIEYNEADEVQAVYYEDNPLCYDTEAGAYSQVQHYAKAYPAPRMLDVLKGVSCPEDMDGECTEQAVVASICPRQFNDPNAGDYGYRPVIRALLLNLVVGAAK